MPITACQQEGRVRRAALELLHQQGALEALHVRSHPGGETRFIEAVSRDDVADGKFGHPDMLTEPAAGLADFGKAGNYFERQVARWTRQYRDAESESIPAMEALIAELPGRIPADQSATIAHGDYRLENVMFHPTEPRLIAVLDWELSTIGHPLADIAYNSFIWRSHSPGWGSLDGVDFAASGIPTEEEYVAAYCRRTGRARIEDWAFYMAFGIFRLASISQGVYRRVLAGTAATEGREAVNGTPALAAQALDILQG
jgi:aminoglycoside phosphotransferase (APT) family kinase protein